MKEGHNIFLDEKVQRFQNKADKYFAHLLGCNLTADYRGRDLASLRHRRVGKANSHGYLLLSVYSGKMDKRLG